MSTRTAIFKEQENGRYYGIYCHHDGYIEGVGKTLVDFYSDIEKTQNLIEKKIPLSSLGQENIIKETYNKVTGKLTSFAIEGIYCTASNLENRELFVATKLKQIQNLNYFTLNENKEIQGYDDRGRYRPYRGSDNNGYVYVQDLKGNWFVSVSEKKFKKVKNTKEYKSI